jgi:hypothetical protein
VIAVLLTAGDGNHHDRGVSTQALSLGGLRDERLETVTRAPKRA